MIEHEVNRLRTLASIRDGYGGDTYRRRFVDGVAQCGCRWVKAEQIPEAFELGVRGDVLQQCELHQHHTEVSNREFEEWLAAKNAKRGKNG